MCSHCILITLHDHNSTYPFQSEGIIIAQLFCGLQLYAEQRKKQYYTYLSNLAWATCIVTLLERLYNEQF